MLRNVFGHIAYIFNEIQNKTVVGRWTYFLEIQSIIPETGLLQIPGINNLF